MMIFKEWGRQRKTVICKWLHVSRSETKREAQEEEQGKYTYFVGKKEFLSLHFILKDILTLSASL